MGPWSHILGFSCWATRPVPGTLSSVNYNLRRLRPLARLQACHSQELHPPAHSQAPSAPRHWSWDGLSTGSRTVGALAGACRSSVPTLAPAFQPRPHISSASLFLAASAVTALPAGSALWAWGKALLTGGSPRPPGTCCWALRLCWGPACPLQVMSPLGPRREMGRSLRQGSHLQGVPDGGVASDGGLAGHRGPTPSGSAWLGALPSWKLTPPPPPSFPRAPAHDTPAPHSRWSDPAQLRSTSKAPATAETRLRPAAAAGGPF